MRIDENSNIASQEEAAVSIKTKNLKDSFDPDVLAEIEEMSQTKKLLDKRAEGDDSHVRNRQLSLTLNKLAHESKMLAEELASKKLDNELRLEELKLKRQEVDFREKTFPWVKKITRRYLTTVGFIFVFCILFFQKEALNSSTLIALLTTTTVSIVGLSRLVVGSVFPKK